MRVLDQDDVALRGLKWIVMMWVAPFRSARPEDLVDQDDGDAPGNEISGLMISTLFTALGTPYAA